MLYILNAHCNFSGLTVLHLYLFPSTNNILINNSMNDGGENHITHFKHDIKDMV